MKYIDYLKDNIISIIIYVGTCLLIFLMLNAFKLDVSVNVLIEIDVEVVLLAHLLKENVKS